MVSPQPRRPPADASTNSGVLPLDVVYEILLHVPAKSLCRLRAVCRQWWSLLSDTKFIAVHAARQPDEPPLIVSHHTSPTENKGALFDILDLSGRVLKQVPMAVGEEHRPARSTQLDFVLFHGGASLRLLDPTSGTIHALPDGLAEEHEVRGLNISDYSAMVAASRIRATGELKVLRVLSSYPRHYGPQLCEICTVVGDGSHPRWRGINAPPREIGIGHWHGAVISAIVYFLYEWHDEDAGPDRIISFDLETEEWRPTLVGPLTSLLNDNTDDDYDHDTYFEWYDYTLASLSGRLVFVHDTPMPSTDLWVLMDAEKGSWVMQHRIETSFRIQPLLVLDDERIVFVRIGHTGSVMIYNPRTMAFTNTSESRVFYAVGLYTGSMLSLAHETMN